MRISLITLLLVIRWGRLLTAFNNIKTAQLNKFVAIFVRALIMWGPRSVECTEYAPGIPESTHHQSMVYGRVSDSSLESIGAF